MAALVYKYVFDPYRGAMSMDEAVNRLGEYSRAYSKSARDFPVRTKKQHRYFLYSKIHNGSHGSAKTHTMVYKNPFY